MSVEIERRSSEGGTHVLRAAGSAVTAAEAMAFCAELQAALPGGAAPLALELVGEEAAEALSGSGEPWDLLRAAEALQSDLGRRVAPLLVRASGAVTGPAVALALRADLLLVSEGMVARPTIWEDRALPLPGEIPGLLAHLGRATALEVLSSGRSVPGEELVERGGALTGEPAEAAWARALRGSPVAQAAASRLLRRRETGRDSAEAMERAAFALCFAAADRTEGVRAFLERRQPAFGQDDDA